MLHTLLFLIIRVRSFDKITIPKFEFLPYQHWSINGDAGHSFLIKLQFMWCTNQKSTQYDTVQDNIYIYYSSGGYLVEYQKVNIVGSQQSDRYLS